MAAENNLACVADVDETAFLLLHEIRLRGIVVVADDKHAPAETLVELGFAAHTSRGVRITPTGRETHASWARLAAGSDAETVMQRAYERFLPLNRELVRICHDWQLRPGGTPNDHRDARYDWGVVDRLRALDERAAPVVSRAGRAHARFTTYRARLRHALGRVEDGDRDWMASPRLDSYHTVWMQFHEDVLLALGADRGDEPEM
jgi:hypothetical protein